MTPEIAALITQYGYAAVFVGALFEGETVVLLAGFMAHQGYLHAPGAAIAAFSGSLASDQLLYMLGRHKGPWLLSRFPRLANAIQKAGRKLGKHEALLILTFRFIYGIRNVTPLFLGIHGTRPQLFIPLNTVSAAIWATLMIAAGYFAGETVTRYFTHIHRFGPFILGGLVTGMGFFWVYRYRKKKSSNTHPTPTRTGRK